MDARNPLITQWVVFCVKALTAGHPANQATLAGLRREGRMDGSLLKELGIKSSGNTETADTTGNTESTDTTGNTET